jgi:hypothetical protein
MFEDNEDEIYNIDDFSDKELINDILDLNNPTDRELEAKIVMMIDKYSDEKSNSYNEKLSIFFNEIYGRFFDIEEEEDEDDDDYGREGFENMNTIIKDIETSTKPNVLDKSKRAFYDKLKNTPGSSEVLNELIKLDKEVEGKVSEVDNINISLDGGDVQSTYVNKFNQKSPGNALTSLSKNTKNDPISPWNDESTVNVRSVDYRRGWINPLIKETIKRIIYLDSQFRDLNAYPLSTDYTFNLSEPLIDVLSLKLYAINIPYSWYTISTSRGANKITLKGISPGIDDGLHDIVITIPPGCYPNPSSLITAVDDAILNLPIKYPDVSFNDTDITYDSTTTFSTFKININATYTTSKLVFPNITNPYDVDSVRIQSIPGFLGFNTSEYSSTEIYSNPEYTKPKTFVSSVNAKSLPVPLQLYNKDVFQLYEDGENQNNFFTINIKKGEIVEEILVKLRPPESPFNKSVIKHYTRDALLNLVNDALKNNEKISKESGIELVDIRYAGSKKSINTYQTYKLNIVLDRTMVLHIEDMEQYISFPMEQNPFPIWTGVNSCFMFDESYTEPFHKELGHIESDTSPMEMRYIVYSSPYIILNCIVDPSYSYRIDIPNSSKKGYTKAEYIQVLNDAFITQSQTFDISLNIIIEEDLEKNKLHFMVIIYKNIDEYTNITELDYQVEFYDASGSYIDINGKHNTSWKYYLGLKSNTYMLFDATYNNIISDYSEFYAENAIRDIEMIVTDENNTINIEQNGQIIPIILTNGVYTKSKLYGEINRQFSLNPSTRGSTIKKIVNPLTREMKTSLLLKATTTYTTKDYQLVFYDVLERGSCDTGTVGEKSLTHTTWDYTLGWILGFRNSPTYFMDAALYPNGIPNKVNIAGNTFTLTGNTGVNINLINQCFIVLDDFTQNHINDGVVTMTNADKSIPLPSYANRATYRCDPVTGKQVPSFKNSNTNASITQRLLYAAEQLNLNAQPTDKYYSDPPYIKDMFAIVPIKIPANQGDSFVEYGGSLQDNDRKYFGPVNINRVRVQLLTDRGSIINLNNRNWSFSIVVECKYTANKDDTNTKPVK